MALHLCRRHRRGDVLLPVADPLAAAPRIRAAGAGQRRHRGDRLRAGRAGGVAGQQAVQPAAARPASGCLAVAGRRRRDRRGALPLPRLELAAGGTRADGHGPAAACGLRPRPACRRPHRGRAHRPDAAAAPSGPRHRPAAGPVDPGVDRPGGGRPSSWSCWRWECSTAWCSTVSSPSADASFRDGQRRDRPGRGAARGPAAVRRPRLAGALGLAGQRRAASSSPAGPAWSSCAASAAPAPSGRSGSTPGSTRHRPPGSGPRSPCRSCNAPARSTARCFS